MKTPPAGFIASIDFNAGESPEIETKNPWLVYQYDSFKVQIKVFPGAEICHDKTSGLVLVFSGWVKGGFSLQQIGDLYRKKGGFFADDLDGSFTLLIVDLQEQKALAITDRVGSRSIFNRDFHGHKIISTSVTALAGKDFKLSQAGLAWYLTNGVVHNLGSIFEGISRLERASIYEFSRGNETHMVYWKYTLDDAYAGRSAEELKSEMEALLIDSVLSTLPGARPLIFSLSRGYDVSGILAILVERLGVKEISTFSYGLDPSNPEFDAYLARELAVQYQLPNRFIPSYRGKLSDVLEKNASQWGGVAEFCDEIDVWETLEGEYGGWSLPVYTGELAFGWWDAEINTVHDVLNYCLVRSFNNFKFIKSLLNPSIFRELTKSLEEDTMLFVERYPDWQNLYRVRDQMFMDVVKPNTLLPWREYYAGRIFEYHAPYHSRELLEFTMKLPEVWRNGKRLYRETITSMFPHVLSTMARSGGVMPKWDQEFLSNRKAVADQFILNGTSTPLDEYINITVLMQILNLQGNPSATQPSQIEKMSNITGRVANRIFNRKTVYHKQISSDRLLLRCLVLRRYLEKINEEAPVVDLNQLSQQ